MNKVRFSVIVTASNEGIMAHKTMRSIEAAVAELDDYEVLITIDGGSEATKEYFSRYRCKTGYRVLENNFADVSKSRNSAVKEAWGEFVFFLDADDLLSDNFFVKSLEVLESSDQEAVVHPEYCLSFDDCGEHCTLQRMGGSSSAEKDAFLLLSRNRWVSAMGGRRDTFLKHPYYPNGNGFGHEDYALNIDLTESSVKHVIASDTVFFYRRKRVSLLTINSFNFYTQPYSKLFSIERWKKMSLPKSEFAEFAPVTKKQFLKNVYVRLRSYKIPNFFITPLANIAKTVTHKRVVEEERIPEALLRAWKQVAKIETQIYPTEKLVTTLEYYTTENYSLVSEAYWSMCQQAEEGPDYVFVVPWLVPGGSDKVLLHYLRVLKEIHPKWRIAVIATVPAKNEWKSKMPSNSCFIDFGNAAKDLSWDDRELLFTRLMVQLKVSKLHIINSEFGYSWVRLHQELVKSRIELYASLFCHGVLSNTNGEGVWDFADPDAARVYHLIRKVYTDNYAVVRKLACDYGFNEEKIVVHHQPVKETAPIPFSAKNRGSKLRVLWASRISAQKNPDLLVRIAKKLNPDKIAIDAYGRIDPIESGGFQFPKKLKSLTYCGKFEGLDSIELSKYDILLYTSIVDGMPNIILEAAAAGLASISSNTGGISDFVHDGETGFLVDDIDNEDCYVEVLNKLEQNRGTIRPLAKAARQLARNEYSWKAYKETVKKDF